MSARAAAAARHDAIDDAIGGAAALPPAPRRVRVGMPQLDLTGLSEGWFLRYAGDLHWEAITRRLGVASDQIRDDGDERLYPTVVALRAHYQPSLGAVRENDLLTTSVEVAPCGGACALGRIAATVSGSDGGARMSLELLTTFARRDPAGTMRMALPAARHAARWAQVGVAPALAQLARAARRGQPLDDRFAGPSLTPAAPPLGRIMREPSPYSDYNGARLLYFASYPTLADDAERHLVRRLGLCTKDWALATSPTRRDVFYYGNLPLGESLIATLMTFDPDREGVKTRVRLTRASDGQAIADLVTRRVFTPEARVR
jgi:probable biosynthetic protein (TIGR04098 family)